jgi:hypothetical protein
MKIIDNPDKYLINYDGDIIYWYVQRKYAIRAIDNPMSPMEKMIIKMCERILELENENNKIT